MSILLGEPCISLSQQPDTCGQLIGEYPESYFSIAEISRWFNSGQQPHGVGLIRMECEPLETASLPFFLLLLFSISSVEIPDQEKPELGAVHTEDLLYD